MCVCVSACVCVHAGGLPDAAAVVSSVLFLSLTLSPCCNAGDLGLDFVLWAAVSEFLAGSKSWHLPLSQEALDGCRMSSICLHHEFRVL